MESDEALYRHIRKGSSEAFQKVYEKYERPLYAYILRQLNQRQEAEEVFQETMLAIFKGPELKALENGLGPWLFKVAHHKCLNQLRSRRRESLALVSYQHEDKNPEAESEPTPEDLKRLDSTAQNLHEPLRQVYQLRREGKSYEEMSEIVGVPVGTIKSRIHKMMAQLRKDVSEWIAK